MISYVKENACTLIGSLMKIYYLLSLAVMIAFFLPIISSATQIFGTNSNDIIYFGYNDSCYNGHGGLLVCILDEKGKPIESPKAYNNEYEILSVWGSGGNDIIQFVANEPKGGGVFDDYSGLRFSNIMISGNDGNDRLLGWGDRCIVFGDQGNDYIQGGEGDDSLWGGDGNDFLLGGTGSDHLFGGDGDDVLAGGNGRDYIIGGDDDDTYRCRNPASPEAIYDGDPTTDCGDWIFRDVEHVYLDDPYLEWVHLTFNARGINYHMQTTSNPALLRFDRSKGAKILMYGNNPLHATHKQYDDSCGPSSLNPVLEYLGIADRSLRLKLFFGLDYEDMTPRMTRALMNRMADVGYFGSTENIMYLGYRIDPEDSRKNADNPDYFMHSHHLLNLSAGDQTKSFFEIQYPIGGTNVQSWTQYGPPVGDTGLAKVANDYFYPITNARFSGITSTSEFKRSVKQFIDNGVPTVLGVENGGHFNTLIGYWEFGDYFFIYTADPLDGYGREFTNKPMRWIKWLVTQDAIDSHAIHSIMYFDHPWI